LAAARFVMIDRTAGPTGAILSATSKEPPLDGWSPEALPLRAPVHLNLSSGTLRGTAILAYPYDPFDLPAGVPSAGSFGIATYDTASRTWLNVPVRLDPRTHVMIAKVSHFSWWEPWTWHWSAIGGKLSQNILSLLGKRVSPPDCAAGPLPRFVQTVITESDSDDPLYSCAQNDDGSLEVKLVDNRNYGDVLHFGTLVSRAHHDNGGNPIQALVSGLIDKHLKANQLCIPPLAGGYVVIPDSKFSTATFNAGPTMATLFADVLQVAFGGLNLAKYGGLYAKLTAACGQFITTAPLPTSRAAVLSDIESLSGCLGTVVDALAHSGSLDGRSLAQLERTAGFLTFLDHVTDVGTAIGVASELGDLVLGATSDRPLREFVVYHQVRTAPAPAAKSPAPASTSGYSPGSHCDDYCVIAWPTAPVYTSTSVEMTMSCEHVNEDQYLFTDVIYNDPSFQPTPDSGQMHVVGTVIGTAHSDYGFDILQVQASQVSFTTGGGG
jgi:hypothetical protein